MTNLTIKRYEIYFADLNPTKGSELRKTRPVVVVSHDAMNRHSETLVVCPLTSKLHPKWRHRFQTNCAGKICRGKLAGIPIGKISEIAVDQIRTLSKVRFKKKIDELSTDDASRLRFLITEMYGE